MKILGISGSPIPDSNTDRAVKAVLSASGIDNEFYKLSDYAVSPCNACLGCVKTNRCVIKDDGNFFVERVKEATALVIGGFTPYSTLDSRTKAFMERMYPLRHNHGFLKGKPGASVISSCVPENAEGLPPAGMLGANAVQFFMMEEGMNYLGNVNLKGNVPCLTCGNGDSCSMTGITMLYGPDATTASVGLRAFEEQPEAAASAQEIGLSIKAALKK